MESVPGATPVTKPLSVTVAIAVLLLLKCTVLIDAFGGETVALSWYVPPMEIAIVDGLITTPVTATGVIVILATAVNPPSTVVAVIVIVPGAIPVTSPLWLTDAIDELLLA